MSIINCFANLITGVNYSSFRLQNAPDGTGVAPLTWSSDLAANGITWATMDSAGNFAGTPPAAGTYTFNLTVTDALGKTVSHSVYFNVKEPNPKLQPQQEASSVGASGPSNLNFSFPATGTPSVTNDGTTVTVSDPARFVLRTSATFVVAAVNSTQTATCATTNGFLVGDFCIVSDGTHTFTGQVTAIVSTTQITIKTLVISGGVAGNTMASNATITPAAMPQASSTIAGYLSAADWTTFNNKGSGTVTSVGLSLPAIFTVTVSPIVGSGTLTATLANQNANQVFAGPASGGAAAPTFRALVAADLPAVSGAFLKYTFITAGTTFTTQAATTKAIIRGKGAGGGSGGCAAAGGGTYAVSGGGGEGGEFVKSLALTGNHTYTIAIGAAGTAGPAGNTSGGNGGATTFNDGTTTYTANGGTGGGGDAGSTGPSNRANGGAGGTATNGDSNKTGRAGDPGLILAAAVGAQVAGRGAGNSYGAGADGRVNSAGTTLAGTAATLGGYLEIWEFS